MWVSLWVVVCVSVMCALHVVRKPPPSGVWWGPSTHTPTTLSNFGHYPCVMFMLDLLISHYINLFSLNLFSLNISHIILISTSLVIHIHIHIHIHIALTCSHFHACFLLSVMLMCTCLAYCVCLLIVLICGLLLPLATICACYYACFLPPLVPVAAVCVAYNQFCLLLRMPLATTCHSACASCSHLCLLLLRV